MFQTLRNAWKIEELRKKILYTLLIIVIFRIGSAIPVPFLDPAKLQAWMSLNGDGNVLAQMNMLSGGALSQATLFAMSITPFINAQIIIQLLTYALPPLERLSKEGMEGRKVLQKITDFVALGIAAVQGIALYLTMQTSGALTYTIAADGASGFFAAAVIIVTLMAGASLIIWLGNQVNEKGIGNGISIILFAGIIARGPAAILTFYQNIVDDPKNIFLVLLVIAIFIAMVGFIVLMNESERRIPVQYAKRVVGRKQYGGQNTHIPIKVAMSGVMPIIFAMTFMQIPGTFAMFWPAKAVPETGWDKFYLGFVNFFKADSPWYAVIYFVLIIAFNYFYVAMMYNPIEIANNLRQSNGGIPGIRPGKPTSDYIQRVLSKITLVGAFFLGVIAIFPIFFGLAVPKMNISMGGTSILILVSVALETTRALESDMMMRHHKGFLE